jgi:hypothetical protein
MGFVTFSTIAARLRDTGDGNDDLGSATLLTSITLPLAGRNFFCAAQDEQRRRTDGPTTRSNLEQISQNEASIKTNQEGTPDVGRSHSVVRPPFARLKSDSLPEIEFGQIGCAVATAGTTGRTG